MTDRCFHTNTVRKNNLSGFRGVGYHPQSGKWQAKLTINKKNIYLGLYDTPEKAHDAYLDERRKYFVDNEILVPEEDKIKYRKKWRHNIKRQAIENYGGKCACCGEENYEFLTIDHIGGGGSRHRKELGSKNIFVFLRDNNYPKDKYQVLCMNCNWSLGVHGYCPHKSTIREQK